MPSPTLSSSTSIVDQTSSLTINALLAGVKWGAVAGTGVAISYSFPWTTLTTASFFGHDGVGSYSTDNEQNATEHYGLNTTQQAAARNALQAWANVADLTFSEIAETASNVGDIRFAWTSATDTTISGTLAWGWAAYPSSYWPRGGDIWISTTSSANTDWSIGSQNYKSILHELGHSLGLKHPFKDAPILSGSQDSQQYTAMSYTVHPYSLFGRVIHNSNGSVSWNTFNVVPDTPMLYDIAAMQYLYGPNLFYKTGNDVYTFDPSTPFLRTIWDAGGSDTISVSNFSKSCVIDLQQGHFSKIAIESDSTAIYTWASPPTQPTYDGTDNLAIAFGCVIENAVGGSGNDTLTGNDANNSLDGGAGNDIMYGGAGNDIFDWDASARGGNDVFYGGTGDDTYVLSSLLDSVVEYSGEGNDTVQVPFSYSIANLPNIENVLAIGSTGVTLTGNAADNWFSGSTGNDTINGGVGKDTVHFTGPRSNYTITPITGGFTIASTADGKDTLIGVEFTQFSDQTVTLGIVDATAPIVTIFSPADESMDVSVASNIVVTFSESVARGTGSIVLMNAAGQVVETLNADTGGNLTIAGSVLTINPTANLSSSTEYKVVFAAGTINDLSGNHYAGTATYNFTTVGNVILGTTGNDVFTGGAGNDTISGGDGADWLYGGGGSDTINGDAGNDYLYGQAGSDILVGGDGADIVSGGDGNDTLYGEWGDDGMYGDAGNDVMNGNGGGDFMAGGDDNDIVHGDDGQDWIYGEWGGDTLYGDAGNDFLFGNFGNDTLIGGLGNDTFYGGEGGDTFIFTANQGEDFIVDFSVTQGDHISIASGTNGITTAAQALAHMRDSGANAVLDLGAGNYVMLMGVATSSLHATDFVIA